MPEGEVQSSDFQGEVTSPSDGKREKWDRHLTTFPLDLLE
jgi:hypothetical protein